MNSLSFAATTAANWQKKAQNVCDQLTTAFHAYQQGDMQQAHLNAVMAYFQNYDLQIEPAARKVFPQSHIFEIEQMFNKLNKDMVEHPSTSQIDAINKQTNNLCQTILNDAKTMDTQNITSSTVGATE